MKKLYSFLCLLFVIFSAAAKDWVALTSASPKAAGVELVSSDVQNTTLKVTVPGFYINSVSTSRGNAASLSLDNAYPLLEAGAPGVIKLSASVAIPDRAKMKVEIVSSAYTDLANYELAPSKGTVYRSVNISDVPYTYGPAYSQNNFYPGSLAALQSPYIIRDYRGQSVWIYPFQYNPVTKVLRVYSEMTIRISEESQAGINVLNRSQALAKTDKEFHEIYSGLFINHRSLSYTPVEETGSMLVISHSSFMTDMQPFVEWKNKRGLKTEMIDVATAGNTAAAIKSYIVDYYSTHNLKYVLLVGDAAQIPTLTASGGSSDPSYGYIVGSDSYPEVFVGRFSATSATHVQTQVSRMIDYERYPEAGADWYAKAVGIASNQGPGDDNEMDWEHERNIRTKLLAFTYTDVAELYDGTHGILDEAGDPDVADLVDVLNEGVTMVNYTGHGSQTAFVTTGFSTSDMGQLTNYKMLPFVCSVGCVNGDFASGTCLGESFMHSQNTGQATGAISAFMSSINQYWNEPMRAQDEMVDLLVGSHVGNVKRTIGGLCFNGCMNMNDVYGSSGYDMTNTWHIFGDPSLTIRTDLPSAITATHDALVYTGTTQLSVDCNTEDALVSLTINGEIIGTGVVAAGNATVTFPALSSVDTIDVVITAFNAIPYEAQVAITLPVSVAGISPVNSLNIHPNPAHDMITIHSAKSAITSITIYNSIGQQVQTEMTRLSRDGQDILKVNTSEFERGVYLVKLVTNDGEHTRQFVIE